jgi:flagellar biosynthesis/type III secretory pathway chaperone
MTLQRAEVYRLLDRVLDEESRLLAQLEALLREETAILGRNQIDEISRIGSSRQGCVEALTRLEAERTDCCRMLSFGQGGGALLKLYDWCNDDGSLAQRWRANLDIARRCQQLNDGNGAIVVAKLSRVQKLLMAVRGSAAPPVYSARGARYGNFGSRDFGRA